MLTLRFQAVLSNTIVYKYMYRSILKLISILAFIFQNDAKS